MQWEYCKLSFEGSTIYYTTYHQDGAHTISHPYDENVWAWAINSLGLFGWEAVSIVGGYSERHWYFKRIFDPENGNFVFS